MESITINAVAVVLLLAANAFFVAAEFAVVKARGFRIAPLASEGRAAAQLALRIQADAEAYLAACQLGITMASLGLGWVGEPTVAAILEPLFERLGLGERLLHSVSFLLGFLTFSSLHIVLGEQVPKTFAIRKAEAALLLLSYPMHLAYLATLPLNWMLNRACRSVLGAFGVADATHAEVMSGTELKGMVATSKEYGKITEGKAEMLKNLFDFDQRVVRRVMIPSSAVTLLDVSGDPRENLRRIRESGHSRFPVIDGARNNALLGMVIAKDVQNALLDGQERPWERFAEITREALLVPETQRVPRLFETMRARRAHMAMVIDEYGEFVGIVTMEDLIEEIVGEIQDETDVENPDHQVVATGVNRWETNGLLSLDDAERLTGLTVPGNPDANSLSGLCMLRLGRMPEAGDEVEESGYRIKVVSIEDCHVAQVVIEKVEADDPAAESAGMTDDTNGGTPSADT